MADWKKIVVSGSNAELANLTATGQAVKFTGVSGSSYTTPLVIDSLGNISTGSAYALSTIDVSSGNSLENNIAIIGAGTTNIQTASSTQHINANGAKIYNSHTIEAGIGKFNTIILSSSVHNLSKTSLTLSSSEYLSASIASTQSFLEVPSGLDGLAINTTVTMSNVPESVKPPFFLTLNSSGQVEKIAESNVQGGGGGDGVTGITTCSLNDNINISVDAQAGTESEEEFITTSLIRAYIAGNNGVIIYLSNGGTFLSDGVHLAPSGTLIRLKGVHSVTQQQITQDFYSLGPVNIGGTIDGDGSNFGVPNGIPFDETSAILSTTNLTPGVSGPASQSEHVLSPSGHLVRASIFKVTENVGTGVVEICLNENLDIKNLTASGVVNASGGIITTDLTASGSVTLDGTLSFNGLNFTQTNVGIITGSNIFGSGSQPSLVTHEFTGSVFITGSNLTVTDGTITGNGGGLSGIPASGVAMSDLVDGNGIVDFTYNGQSGATITVELDGSTLAVGASGLKVNTSGINTNELADNSVTADKLNDDLMSGQDSELTTGLASTDELLISNGGTLKRMDVSVLQSYMQDTLTFTNNSDTTYDFSLADGTNTAILTLDASGDGDDDTVTFAGTNGEITVDGFGTADAGTVTIGLPSDVTIGNNLTVSNDLSVTNNATITGLLTVNGGLTLGNTGDLTVDGNLTVNGTTTTLNTQDLHVEDRFILIGSGSSKVDNTDVGIIFDSGSVDGAGMALYYNNSENRLSVGIGVNDASMGTTADIGASGGGQGTASGHLVTAEEVTTVSTTDLPTFGAGEIRIDNGGDIWMYVCPPVDLT